MEMNTDQRNCIGSSEFLARKDIIIPATTVAIGFNRGKIHKKNLATAVSSQKVMAR